MTGKVLANVAHFLVYKKKNRGSVTHIADRLGNPGPFVSEWLLLTAKENMPKPNVEFFPKPPKAADGSLMYDRIPNKPEVEKILPIAAVVPSSATNTIGVVSLVGNVSSNSPPPPLTPNTVSTIVGTSTTSPVTTTGPAAVVAASVAVVSPSVPTTASSTVNSLTSNSLKRRTYDDSNGVGDSKLMDNLCCTHLCSLFLLLFSGTI